MLSHPLASVWLRRLLALPIALAMAHAVPAESSESLAYVTADPPFASVTGGPSLRATIEQLCWDAGIGLQYDAADEPFALTLRDQPLPIVLARLLRGHSYLLQMDHGTSASRVKSLHVLGANGQWRRQQGLQGVDSTAPPAPFGVPGEMLDAAFKCDESMNCAPAIQRLTVDIAGDSERLRSFLAANVTTMASALRRYPGAANVLRQIAAGPQLTDSMRDKLDRLIDALDHAQSDAAVN